MLTCEKSNFSLGGCWARGQLGVLGGHLCSVLPPSLNPPFILADRMPRILSGGPSGGRSANKRGAAHKEGKNVG